MSATVKSLDAHIVATPGTCGGKPRIAGRRITVANVAIWHEQMGWSVEEIAAEFDLALADVHAALAYYFDNREEIDQRIREDEEFAEKVRTTDPSVLRLELDSPGEPDGEDD
jgi:uncharacterized protein (DUF433 family)